MKDLILPPTSGRVQAIGSLNFYSTRYWKVLTTLIKQEQEIKCIVIEKKKVTLSLHESDMTIYVQYPPQIYQSKN